MRGGVGGENEFGYGDGRWGEGAGDFGRAECGAVHGLTDSRKDAKNGAKDAKKEGWDYEIR